jgi:hypothetical protein
VCSVTSSFPFDVIYFTYILEALVGVFDHYIHIFIYVHIIHAHKTIFFYNELVEFNATLSATAVAFDLNRGKYVVSFDLGCAVPDAVATGVSTCVWFLQKRLRRARNFMSIRGP